MLDDQRDPRELTTEVRARRKPWSAPLIIGTLRFSETQVGSVTTYPESVPTVSGLFVGVS